MTVRVLAALKFNEHFEFQRAEFAVGDDKEVAAAAGRVEEAELGQLVLKFGEARGAARGAVGFDALEFGAEIVEEKRADEFEDVLLRRVVRANLAAFLGVHDRLKERTEDGGRDGFPVKAAAWRADSRACRR